jgi:CelD/BcsL family acetyltransferase involved in cellulose biosynthesis
LRVMVARSAGEMERLRPAWEHLARSNPRSIFQQFAWNRLAAQVFADRESPYVVYAESENGAALIPAALGRDGSLIVFLGETLFDYRTFLADGDREALEAAWREIGKLRRQLWVTSLPQAWTADWHDWSPQPFSAAPGVLRGLFTASGFADQHPRARRLLRRLLDQGIELRRYSGAETALVRWILEQKARQLWDDPQNLFSDQRRIDFVSAALALDPSSADIFTLEQGSAIISALITLRDGSMRRFYNTYHDERWAKLSPGIALLYEVTRLSLEEGLDCDYMTGTQPHKMRLANVSVPLYRVDASPEQVGSRAAQASLLAA